MKKRNLAKGIFVLVVTMVMLLLSATSCFAATEVGKYPTRKGTILVTPDKLKGLIPTGHAAIVYSKKTVIESRLKGVMKGKNNWNKVKNVVYGVGVRKTTAKQDASAANWCLKQVKLKRRYNFNYFDVKTRKRFYCSQLVWAAFKDKYKIDMNTSLFGKAVHPMELVDSPETYACYLYRK